MFSDKQLKVLALLLFFESIVGLYLGFFLNSAIYALLGAGIVYYIRPPRGLFNA